MRLDLIVVDFKMTSIKNENRKKNESFIETL